MEEKGIKQDRENDYPMTRETFLKMLESVSSADDEDLDDKQ